MKILVWSFVFWSSLLFNVSQAQEFPLLPYPQRIAKSSSDFRIDTAIYFHISNKIDSNLKHYVYWAGTRMAAQTNKVLVIDLEEDSTYTRSGIWVFFDEIQEPCVKANEGYRIEVNKNIIKVCASTSLGAMRALETLTQLVLTDQKGFYFPGVIIEDKPDFAWRGLLIDVARHYIPMSVLYRNIDAMAMAKMNVLHLHLTEDQGFRIESKKFPALHEKGSNGEYYTQAEMKKIVAYASSRGVRVVPEFDMPGHTTSWLAAYPELGSVPGATYANEKNYGVFRPAFDPTNEKVYEFLDAFIHEMASIFKDTCFHIGGDEVLEEDWKNNSKIQQFMLVNNMKNAHDLQAYFNQRVEKIVRSCGKRMIGWDEVLSCKPSRSTIIQSWRGEEYMDRATAQGYSVVRSNGYYLDHTFTAGEYYERKNTKSEGKDSTRGSLLGLEAAMWSELVDSNTIDSRIWPNTAAIAELAWNTTLNADTLNLYKRLISFSERCTAVGLHHDSYVNDWIKTSKLDNEEIEVRLICGYLKPVSGYARHKLIKNTAGYNTSVPLNTIADMARPTSDLYMKFMVSVDEFRKNPKGKTKDNLATILNEIIQQHEVLQRRAYSNKSLLSWVDLSSQLASAGRIGMRLMKNEASEKNKILEEITVLEAKQKNNTGYTSAILPVLKVWTEGL